MKLQYASNLLIHRMGGGSPLVPVAPVLVLAGGTGPLSSMRVQMFYRWCSRHFKDVYTIVEPQDVGQKILSNIHTLNDRSYMLPNETCISGDAYDTEADILVNDTAVDHHESLMTQIYGFGVFSFIQNGVRHVSNSLQHHRFHPASTLSFQTPEKQMRYL